MKEALGLRKRETAIPAESVKYFRVSSSIGRTPASKAGCWRFDSFLARQVVKRDVRMLGSVLRPNVLKRSPAARYSAEVDDRSIKLLPNIPPWECKSCDLADR